MRFHLYLTILMLRVSQYVGQDCGQVFDQSQSSSGTFTSPNFPRNYDNLMQCTWGFRPESGYSVTIRFTDFNLEGSFTCSFDSVRVGSKRYCGTTLPDDIISTTNIDVIFKTDISVTRKGFSATYRFIAGTVDCGHPGVPLHGNKTGDTYTYQSVVTFGCQEGYDLIGSRSITCQRNGEWTADRPSCRERVINCGDPGIPDNGRKTGSIFTIFSVVTFSCNEGYDIQGSSRVTCDANGLWSDFTPRCIPSCGMVFSQSDMVSGTFTSPNYPGDYGNNRGCTWVSRPWQVPSPPDTAGPVPRPPDPGPQTTCPNIVDLPNGQILGSNNVGSNLQFQCNSGYQLQGSSVITCTSSGQWSESLPSCQRIFCADVPSLSNGQVLRTDNSVGTTVYFQCDSGYQLQGPSSLTCMTSGQWNGNFPYCEGAAPPPSDCADTTPDCRFYSDGTYCQTDQVVIDNCQLTCGMCPEPQTTCPGFVDFPNGQILGSDNNVGSVIQFQCNSGYQLQGPSSRTCMSSGQWSDSMPSCQQIVCPEISFLANGQVLRTDGTAVSFFCDSGYQLHGPSSLTCTPSGQWNDNVPSCQPETGPPQTPVPPDETLTSCADNWGDCDTYLEYCQQQTSDGQTVRENCPLTCGSCPGGTRRKRTVTENGNETPTLCTDNWADCHNFQEHSGTCGSCPGGKRRKRTVKENGKGRFNASCVDMNEKCPDWAAEGRCKMSNVIRKTCRWSCQMCVKRKMMHLFH